MNPIISTYNSIIMLNKHEFDTNEKIDAVVEAATRFYNLKSPIFIEHDQLLEKGTIMIIDSEGNQRKMGAHTKSENGILV